MNKIVLSMMSILFFGCATTKNPTFETNLPILEEKILELNSVYTEKDLTIVEVEKSDNPAGQNGELQALLEKGETAPFSGVLLNPEGVAYVVAEHESQLARAEAALKKQRELDLAKLNFESAKLVIELDSSNKRNKVILEGSYEEINRIKDLYENSIKQSKKPMKLIVVGLGGFVIGVVTGIAATAIIK